MFNLGDKLRDKVTGFQGIATSYHVYLNGCVRWSITSDKLKDGQPIEPQSFDQEQLELVSKNKVKTIAKRTGGPARYEPRL